MKIDVHAGKWGDAQSAINGFSLAGVVEDMVPGSKNSP